jgi:hypothetical protein
MSRQTKQQSFSPERGKLIFDEREKRVIQRRKMRLKLIMIGFSMFLFGVASVFLALIWFGFEQWDFWQGFALLFFIVNFYGLAIVAFLAGLVKHHILLFENGIEFRGWSLRRKHFFPFESIAKVYARIYDESGIKLDYVVLEFNETTKEKYRVLGEENFVDRDRFLELVGKKVSIDSEPREEKDLEKELRGRRILGRFVTLR